MNRNDWIGITAIWASICFTGYSMSAHLPAFILLLAAKSDDVRKEIVTILAGDCEVWHFGVGGPPACVAAASRFSSKREMR